MVLNQQRMLKKQAEKGLVKSWPDLLLFQLPSECSEIQLSLH